MLGWLRVTAGSSQSTTSSQPSEGQFVRMQWWPAGLFKPSVGSFFLAAWESVRPSRADSVDWSSPGSAARRSRPGGHGRTIRHAARAGGDSAAPIGIRGARHCAGLGTAESRRSRALARPLSAAVASAAT